ncbi:MAG: LuxR C-terminal-related transcriptional regulator [Micropepsaceae bacterium]
MTDHYSGLCETLNRISSATTSNLVWSALKELAAHYGYTFLSAVAAPMQTSKIQDSLLYSDARKQMFVEFDRNLTYANHPFVRRAMRSTAPFTVTEFRKDNGDVDPVWFEHMHETVKHGEGLLVPVFKDQEFAGGISFGGKSPDTSAIVKSTMQVASHAAFDRVEELRDQKAPQSAIALSVRETQCLGYIATGHEDDEISRLLGISPRTVRFHVDSAKTKLGVSSRVQAVTKALRERIISV